MLYIPVCPLTMRNAEYVRIQRERFRAGTPGQDFPGGEGESRHDGRPTENELLVGQTARRAMGLEGFVVVSEGGTEGERRVLERANGILGFA